MSKKKNDQVLCPRCNSSSVAEILWGLPVFNNELATEIELGRISLGGCCITFDDPTHECNECKLKWINQAAEPQYS